MNFVIFWVFLNHYFSLDGTPEQVLEKLFRLFDVNEDGTISRPEMLVSSFYVSFMFHSPIQNKEKLLSRNFNSQEHL